MLLTTILISSVSMCRRFYAPHADGFEMACSAGRGNLDKAWEDENEESHPVEHKSAAAMLWANAHGAELMDEQNSNLDRLANHLSQILPGTHSLAMQIPNIYQ